MIFYQFRSLDEAKRNPGIQRNIENPGFTEYIHVFCPSGLHSQFKFNPIEFSHFVALVFLCVLCASARKHVFMANKKSPDRPGFSYYCCYRLVLIMYKTIA